MTPPKLPEHLKKNFNTLLLAAERHDLALVSAIRKADQAPVALVCACHKDEDGKIAIVPLAEMIPNNPYELYENPIV